MTQFPNRTDILRWVTPFIVPAAMWAFLWLGLRSGNFTQIFNPVDSHHFFTVSLRAMLPLIAGGLALGFIAFRLYQRKNHGFSLFGPLTLTMAYGTVGLFAITQSPMAQVAIYWNLSYLTVPLVLFAIAWDGNTLEKVQRIVTLNWFLMVLATTILFIYGLWYLELGQTLINPSKWLDCDLAGSWYKSTSGDVRSTGVGRYAALTGILALVNVKRDSYRSLSSIVFLAAMILLWTSGARTAMLGFGLAVAVILPLLGGRKAVLWGGIIAGVYLAVAVPTGLHQTVLNNCVLSDWVRPPAHEEPASQLPLVNDPSAVPPSKVPPSKAPPAAELNSTNNTPEISRLPNDTFTSEGTPQHSSVPTIVTSDIPADINSPAKDTERFWFLDKFPDGFFTFSGRTLVWDDGWELFKDSPMIGHGFQADRIILGQHMHNSIMHSLIQTGVLGTTAFLSALILVLYLIFAISRNIKTYTNDHRFMFIQSAGVVVFLITRTVWESTGAFFGVDWLLLAPLLLYIQVLRKSKG